MTDRLRSAGWALLPLVAALAVALPLVGSEYAFHDDWTYLDGATGGGLQPALASALAQGRPLHVLVSLASWVPIRSVADLGWLRALSLAGVVALALVVGAWLRGLGMEPAVAAGAATGVVLLGPLVLFAAWAATWPYPWVAAAAFAVGARIDRAAQLGARPLVRGGAWALDLAALVALLLVYPPAALVALVPPAVGPLAERREVGGSSALRGIGVGAALFAIAAPLVAFGQWAARRLAAPGMPASDRMRLVAPDELAARALWWVREPMARSFDLPMSTSPAAVSIVVAVVCVVGVLLAARRRRIGPWAVGGALAVTHLLGSAAAWLPAERHFAWRTIVAPTLLVWLLLVVAVRELAEWTVGPRRGTVLAGALLGAWALAAAVRMIGGFVLPMVDVHERELALLRRDAARIVAERPERVLVRRIDWRAARRPGRYGEWNAFPSSADHWYAGSMVRIATREAGREFRGEVEVVDATEAAAARETRDPSVAVIDYAAAFEGSPDPAVPR